MEKIKLDDRSEKLLEAEIKKDTKNLEDGTLRKKNTAPDKYMTIEQEE